MFQAKYETILAKIDNLLVSAADNSIKQAIKENVKTIRSWLPEKEEDYDSSQKLQASAIASLDAALSILNAIEQIADTQKYKLPLMRTKSFTSEVFSGAHILVDDNGALLQHLKTQMSLFDRFSSHYRNEKINSFKALHKSSYQNEAELQKAAEEHFNKSKPDSSIRAEVIFNELLIGDMTRNGKKYTWLQFEGHSHQPRTVYQNALVQLLDNLLQRINYSIEKFLHHLDYVAYRFHGKKLNIGQYGNSEYTESNALNIEPVKL